MAKQNETNGSEGGFALVVVVWAAGLLAAIAASFALSARTHVREAATFAASARAEALADGGVAAALADLIRQREARRAPRYPPNGTGIACALSDGHRLTITLQDEAGRVDLNAADERLLGAALTAAGEPAARAAALADAIIDFRDSDDTRRTAGAERAEYLAAGRARGPKNAPFDAVEELEQVLGFDAEGARRLAPLVSLDSGLAGIDPKLAVAALGKQALARDLIATSPGTAYAVRVEAETADGARFVREAVVQWTGARSGQPFITKRWRRGAWRGSAQPSNAADWSALPRC